MVSWVNLINGNRPDRGGTVSECVDVQQLCGHTLHE